MKYIRYKTLYKAAYDSITISSNLIVFRIYATGGSGGLQEALPHALCGRYSVETPVQGHTSQALHESEAPLALGHTPPVCALGQPLVPG